MRRWLDIVFVAIAVLGTAGSIVASRMPTLPYWVPMLLIACVSLGLAYFAMLIRSPHTMPPAASVVASAPEEQAYKYFAQRYGIGYGLLDVSWTIKDDGSAIVRRKITVEAYSPKDSLDTFLLVPEALTDGCNISIRKISGDIGRLSVELGITPPLGSGQSVTYEMMELLPASLYAITEDDLAKRTSDMEYCGWSVNRPTRKLSLRVHFPKDRIPEENWGLEVRYASAAPGLPAPKTLQTEEAARLGQLNQPKLGGSGKGHYTLRLDVEYPMVGLIYVLKWRKMKMITDQPETKIETAS